MKPSMCLAPTALAVLLLGGCASWQAPGPDAIRIDHMIIPAAAEAGGPVAAYAGFDNTGPSDRLLGISCTCAASVELHKVVREGEKVSMTNTFPLALPTGRTEVRPPGTPLHFMLIDTSRPFATGEQLTLQLHFEKSGVRDVVFTVVANSKDGWDAWTAE